MLQVQKLVEAYEDRLREEARLAGLDEGKVEEARRAVLRVLTRRGLVVSVEQQAQVEACSNLATLERWLDQAINATTADDALC